MDPLAEENAKMMVDMEKGFLELLALHNTMELSSLCGMLSIKIERKTKNVEKRDYILTQIRTRFANGESPEKIYIGILKFMWEGTLYEYKKS